MPSFQTEVLDKSHTKPVLVDFWAPWCGPCRVFGPAVDRAARASGGSWRLVKINVDAHPELARQYRVQGVPTVKLFREGQVVGEFSGVMSEAGLRQWLAAHGVPV